MTVNEIAWLSKINFFSLPAIGVSRNSSCGESSSTMEALISGLFKGNYLLLFKMLHLV